MGVKREILSVDKQLRGQSHWQMEMEWVFQREKADSRE